MTMAQNRKKRPKKVSTWTKPDEKKRFIHEKLFNPQKDEILLIHKTFKK